MTTLLSYGDMEPARQREIIRELNRPRQVAADGLTGAGANGYSSAAEVAP